MARTYSATERMQNSRAVTQGAMTRELLYAGVLARVWPSYLTEPIDPKRQPNLPALLCVESPAGLLVWRLSLEELNGFKDWIPYRPNDGRRSEDKLVALQVLAFDGWE